MMRHKNIEAHNWEAIPRCNPTGAANIVAIWLQLTGAIHPQNFDK
jgi:hypothetical protein